MKKIVVFICLMFLSSSAFSFSLKAYKNFKEIAPENEVVEAYLEGTIKGTYAGLLAMLTIINATAEDFGTKSNVKLWCSPENIALNYENLIDIIDKEVELKDSRNKKMGLPAGSLDEMPISFILRQGLLETFPYE